MKLILVANEIGLARHAEAAGVDRVLVDLERAHKADRQRGHGLFLSNHTIDDVARLGAALTETELEVRLDPWGPQTPAQVEEVLRHGARVVMLPMVESPKCAMGFVDAIAGRATVSLLVETMPGLAALVDLVAVDGVNEIHIGLNDLMLSRGGRVIFEPLADGSLDDPARVVRDHGLDLGIGGVTSPLAPTTPIDPSCLIGALVRLDVTMGWLGRSFRASLAPDCSDMRDKVESIRADERRWRSASPAQHAENAASFREAVAAWAAREADPS